MSDQHISLRTVYDLRVDEADQPIRYRIPAYQRGFRWTDIQVTQLLEDIRDFVHRENPQPEQFYCLQPVVLKPNEDGSYEVVDGQQRLTTILLILRHYNMQRTERYRRPLYKLEYETRAGLDDFLENQSEEQAGANIDFFHIAAAITAIDDWFRQHGAEEDDIWPALLNRTKVIWFELSAVENPVAAFTRLNVGKIPLTNDELIRALFLRGANGDDANPLQLRIAYEWDLLEKTMQKDDFWYFLTNDQGQRGNRIGFLFDLVARADGMQPSQDKRATFYHFGRRLSVKDADPEQEWLRLKERFMLLEEWFEDRRLYHLLGYLVWAEEDINDLIRLAATCTKRDLKERLRASIFADVVARAPDLADLSSKAVLERITDLIDSLNYGGNNNSIRSTLLLFNLATLLLSSESNMRFQFESFKTQEWDIEHVRSVVQHQPRSRTGQVEWLENCSAYLATTGDEPDLQAEIRTFVELPVREVTDAIFEPLYEKILQYFHETDSGEADNSVANLVLLDSATNRSYQNAVFAVKRRRVLSLDRDGVFVPLCTRNAFLKCYNPDVDNLMFWTQEDRDGYRIALIDTLVEFFAGDWIYE